MTPLEVILIVWVAILIFGHWARGPAFENMAKELDYTRKLYADAIAQLEKTTHERDYYKREWAVRWDAYADRIGARPGHVGAGE